ncbi:putative E3 ubiquitin-protein ligase dtx2 [Mortierella claussenii]|nr:putative E3 ubiquitin-protein ligase dtx2 [Mortierella claussenii]
MPLVNTCQEEFTDMFRKFFEGSLDDLRRHSIPFERSEKPAASAPFSVILPEHASARVHTPPELISNASTLLLNLDPNAEHDLCRTIAGDFYSHTRNRLDYEIQSVHLLRNPTIWKRYQAEKQLRRHLAAQDKAIREQTRAQASINPLLLKRLPVEEEDPRQLFRDEIVYHGTLQRRVPSILLNGLDPRMTVRANYGKGVYFSDSVEKCMQYVDKQTTMAQEYSIVLCCVLLGRVLVEPYDKSKRKMSNATIFLPEGYDSALEHDVFKEWIIFEKSQILPLCVINFKASNRPDSFFRLSAHQVLFRGTSTYPSSITDIQRVCTVSAPVDNNQPAGREAALKLEDWREPDEDTFNMLVNIFDLTHSVIHIRNIHFQSGKEWAVRVRRSPMVQEEYCFMTDAQRTTLLQMSKNISVLQTRLNTERHTTFISRNIQRAMVEGEIAKINNGHKLMELLAAEEPGLSLIQKRGNDVRARIEQIKAQLTQSGQGHMIQEHEYRLHIHPLEQTLAELKKQYDTKFAPLTAWTREELNRAEFTLKTRRMLQQNVRDDMDREKRQADAIRAEKERSKMQGTPQMRFLTKQELDRRMEIAQCERNFMEKSNSLKEDFRLKEVEVTTAEVKVWPMLVAELLMPVLMFTQLNVAHVALLNDNDSYSRVGSAYQRSTEVKDVGEWWHVAPQCIFQAPAASSIFWPVDPRKRLPNRRLFRFKDYIEWMFMEKENRNRKREWRLKQQTAQQAGHQVASHTLPHDLLAGSNIQRFLEEQWELLDPSILRAIEGLSSRFGTVVFDREERQKELDQMGTDLLNELFVDVEPHMLIRDELHGSKARPSSSALPPAECPICQEPLEIGEVGRNTSSNRDATRGLAFTVGAATSTPEKVVKLKSCRHCYHQECIKAWFQSKDAQLKCPMCNTMCTTEAKVGAAKSAMTGQRPQKLGPMPDGLMGYSFDVRLACYFIYIIIPAHEIPNPNPRSDGSDAFINIKADIRYAVVPFSARLGPLLMIRLICLFYYGHLFRVGRSLTRNVNNVVVWNGVHLRTAMTGAYGFPAPHWEINCWQEINQKGVAMGLDQLVMNMPQVDGTAPARTVGDSAISSAGVTIPADLEAELAADELVRRLFSAEQSLLFGEGS